MKKQVGRPPEKRQRLGPRKILRSKKDKKTCPGQGQGRKRGNAAHDERLAAAGAARRAYAWSRPGSRTQNGSMHLDPHGKDKKRTRKNKRHSLVRPQAGTRPYGAGLKPPPAGCRPGRRRMSPLAGCGSAGYNGGQCSRTQAVVCKLYTGKDYRADSHVSVAS